MKNLAIEIEKLVYGGRGLGRAGGKAVFVPLTAPGDRVQVKVIREKKDYAEAVIKHLEKPSPLRQAPFCPLFGDCGGCHYQHLSYGDQLRLKEMVLEDSLRRLARGRKWEALPIVPSPCDRGYRIRAQLKGGRKDGRAFLGFYGLNSHRLVEVKDCPLLHPLANRILRGLQGWLGRKEGEGCVQGADIQVSPDENRGVIRLRGHGILTPEAVQELRRKVPDIKGVAVEGQERASWGELSLFYQGPKIGEKEPLSLQVGHDSFTQVNAYQNLNLITQVLGWAGLTGKERVLDLFCGAGNLTLPLAQQARRVWGIDWDEQAIKEAAKNAGENRLENCRFLAAKAEQGIKEIFQETEGVDLVVLDPPRTGAWEVLPALSRLRPPRVLYVSCDPSTLARDLGRLDSLGWTVKRVQPLDMFPHTYHLETIVECAAPDSPG